MIPLSLQLSYFSLIHFPHLPHPSVLILLEIRFHLAHHFLHLPLLQPPPVLHIGLLHPIT